jgi:D-sedoheptulose 7-phosphate isomerase
MTFPAKKYSTVSEFAEDYFQELATAVNTLNLKNLESAIKIIEETIANNKTVYTCGNGGSTAISDHFVCDFLKGVGGDLNTSLRVYSLVSNGPLITALSNDISYEEIIAFQLDRMGRSGDLLIVISSSGNSMNMVNAIKKAKEANMNTIAFTGFYGGTCASTADVNLHIESDNYGIVEDSHHSLMHIIAQHLRHKNYNDDELRSKNL